jgi:hypothetical protein
VVGTDEVELPWSATTPTRDINWPPASAADNRSEMSTPLVAVQREGSSITADQLLAFHHRDKVAKW